MSRPTFNSVAIEDEYRVLLASGKPFLVAEYFRNHRVCDPASVKAMSKDQLAVEALQVKFGRDAVECSLI